MITVYDISVDFDDNFNFEKSFYDVSVDLNEDFEKPSTTGKINDAEIAICFYNSRRNVQKISAIGGKENSSYGVKAITALLRYTTDNSRAERQALLIQNFFNERKTKINGKNVRYALLYEEPIFLGTDEKGVYEYSFEINVYYER